MKNVPRAVAALSKWERDMKLKGERERSVERVSQVLRKGRFMPLKMESTKRLAIAQKCVEDF